MRHLFKIIIKELLKKNRKMASKYFFFRHNLNSHCENY